MLAGITWSVLAQSLVSESDRIVIVRRRDRRVRGALGRRARQLSGRRFTLVQSG